MAVGIVGYTRTSFKTWVALPVLAIYPLSIFGVYFMVSAGSLPYLSPPDVVVHRQRISPAQIRSA